MSTKNCDWLLDGEIVAKFLAVVLAQPKVKRLMWNDHFSLDGTLIQAWASMKSFRRIDGDDNDPEDGGRRRLRGGLSGRSYSTSRASSTFDGERRHREERRGAFRDGRS